MTQNYKYKHGLVVMRAQPLHSGHEKIIKNMLQNCQEVTVILGSIQEQGTERNPFSYTERKQMIQNVFANELQRLKVMGLFDINNPVEWGNFVLDFIKESLPERHKPDVYYAGSDYDAHWFGQVFDNIEIINRVDYSFPYVSGSMVRDMIKIGDARWKDFISPCNHQFVEQHNQVTKGVI